VHRLVPSRYALMGSNRSATPVARGHAETQGSSNAGRRWLNLIGKRCVLRAVRQLSDHYVDDCFLYQQTHGHHLDILLFRQNTQHSMIITFTLCILCYYRSGNNCFCMTGKPEALSGKCHSGMNGGFVPPQCLRLTVQDRRVGGTACTAWIQTRA
jgi:hypothetical protein